MIRFTSHFRKTENKNKTFPSAKHSTLNTFSRAHNRKSHSNQFPRFVTIRLKSSSANAACDDVMWCVTYLCETPNGRNCTNRVLTSKNSFDHSTLTRIHIRIESISNTHTCTVDAVTISSSSSDKCDSLCFNSIQ